MGETDDSSSFLDRIHSGAKVTAFRKNPSILPTHNQPNKDPTYRPSVYAGHDVLPGAAPARPKRTDSTLDEKNDVDAHHYPASSPKDAPDLRSSALPPAAPPHGNTKEASSQPATITTPPKSNWPKRAKAGSKRFIQHTKDAVFHSWLNVLLIFVPIGIAVAYAPLPGNSKPVIIFAMNAVAIIPLAGLLAHATESVASRMGDTWASLLNVSFGNAVELIIFIIALSKNQISIVQASILGSILANLLLILGMAFLIGGLRYREQIYNSTVTQMSAVLLSLAVMSLLLPTAFHASFSNYATADKNTTKISRGTSVVLLLIYVLYLVFQLKSHAYMYQSTPQTVIDEESYPGVLAGMMNSDSSSTDSSSSSDSDSDTSTGSHITATKRFKRAFKHRKRRKSNASSTLNGSSAAMSSPTSPANEVDSVPESGGYFPHHRRDTLATNASTILSGDEADSDGEPRTHGKPRVRDFQDEKDDKDRRSSIFSKGRKHKHSKKNKKGRKKKIGGDETPATITESPTESKEEGNGQVIELANRTTTPHIGFAPISDNVHSELPSQQASAGAPRRPFAITRSSFRPPIPSVFANTVFATPPPAPGQHLPFSLARGTQLRRTNSLPDRLSSQTSKHPATLGTTASVRTPDASAMNGADAIGKDGAEDDKSPPMSRTAAVMLLLCSTGLVAFCADLLVDAIPQMVENTSVSEAFIGLIILPIVGNAAEHVTAVAVAAKNKMDLAIGIAVGSSIQIALFITPVVVLLGWILNKEMNLMFTLFETISLFVTVFVVNFLVLDGRSNYLEGSLLIAAYIIIALAAFFYPSADKSSPIGGGSNEPMPLLRMFR